MSDTIPVMVSEYKPQPDTDTSSHVTPWSSVPRNVSIGYNREPGAWVDAVSRALLTPSESAILAVIASHTEYKTWAGFRWSIDHLRKWAHVSRSTAEKALRRLRDLFLIRQDGSVRVGGVVSQRHGGVVRRDVVVYRVAGIPGHELPLEVEQARDPDSVVWTDQDQKSLTCKFTYTPNTTPAHSPQHQPSVIHTVHPSRPDVVVDRYVSDHADAERKNDYPNWLPADIATRLTPTQTIRISVIAAETAAREGIAPARIAARIRRWWTATGTRIRSAFGWTWHAIEHRHYGCADPRCEDGDVWDGNRVVARCVGCTERRRDRAAVVRAGGAPTAPYTRPWTPAWVVERADARTSLAAFLDPVAT